DGDLLDELVARHRLLHRRRGTVPDFADAVAVDQLHHLQRGLGHVRVLPGQRGALLGGELFHRRLAGCLLRRGRRLLGECTAAQGEGDEGPTQAQSVHGAVSGGGRASECIRPAPPGARRAAALDWATLPVTSRAPGASCPEHAPAGRRRPMSPTLLLLLPAIAVLAWAILAFNRLVRLRNQVRTAWADIDVQLVRR